MRYKKFLGFYADTEDERHTVYVVDSNDLHNRYGTSERDPEAGSGAEEQQADGAV